MNLGALKRHKFLVAACTALALAAMFALLGRTPDTPVRSSSAVSSGGITIVPSEPFSFHELRASAGAAASLSANGPGAGEITFYWSVNGKQVHTGPTLDPSHFGPEDAVAVRAERTGLGSAAALGHAEIRVLNSVPEIHVVNLQRNREDPRKLQALVDARDADGDSVALRYEWEVDGHSVTRAESDLLPLGSIKPGQRVAVTVVANDGRADSLPARSIEFVHDNRPPEIQVTERGTLRTLADGSRVVSFRITATDPDREKVSVEFPGAPAGLQWDATTGTVSWPLAAEVTSSSVLARATDATGAIVERDLSVSF